MIMELNDSLVVNVLSRNVRHIEKEEYDFYVIKMPLNSTVMIKDSTRDIDVSNATFTLSPSFVKKEIVDTVERSYERISIKLLKEYKYKLTKNKLKEGIEYKAVDGKCVNSSSDFETHIMYLNGEQIVEALRNSRLAYEKYKTERDKEMQETIE